METEIDFGRVKELKDQAVDASENSAGFMQPKDTTKKKVGRPAGSTKKEKAEKQKKEAKENLEVSQPEKDKPVVEIPTSVITIPIAKSISTLGEQYAGHPKARMNDEELDSLAQALGLVMDKYLPDIGNKFGPELFLGLCLSQYAIRIKQVKNSVDIERQKVVMQEQAAKTTVVVTPEPKSEIKEAYEENQKQAWPEVQ